MAIYLIGKLPAVVCQCLIGASALPPHLAFWGATFLQVGLQVCWVEIVCSRYELYRELLKWLPAEIFANIDRNNFAIKAIQLNIGIRFGVANLRANRPITRGNEIQT